MQEFWVFGYGSLMWRPGFAYVERHQALVRGLHRRLCIYSWHHRGTPEQPGLVMGLDRGGACRGIAFKVAAQNWDETVAYLRAREQVTMVYLERHVSARLISDDDRPVTALTYVADRGHEQYAGALSLEDQLAVIRRGHGKSGPCDEYVLSAAEHIQDMGVKDVMLDHLRRELAADRG